MSDSLWPHGLYRPPGSFVHGIFQARLLEWFAISSFRGSSSIKNVSYPKSVCQLSTGGPISIPEKKYSACMALPSSNGAEHGVPGWPHRPKPQSFLGLWSTFHTGWKVRGCPKKKKWVWVCGAVPGWLPFVPDTREVLESLKSSPPSHGDMWLVDPEVGTPSSRA